MARTIDIFISHATEDRVHAERLCAELERVGWSVFLATRDLPSAVQHADWSQRIDEALSSSRLLVLLISPEALNTQWVGYEWRVFHHDVLRKQPVWLIPVCVRAVNPGDLGHPLMRYQAVDMRDVRRASQAMSTLLMLVASHLKRPIALRGPRRHRRALALGGVGTSVMLTECTLGRLEHALSDQAGDSGLQRLSTSFDVVFGASASALVAALALLGVRHEERLKHLQHLLQRVFRRRLWRKAALLSFHRTEDLLEAVHDVLGSRTLGDVPQLVIGTIDSRRGQSVLWSALPGLGPATPQTPLAPLVAASIASPLFFSAIEVRLPDKTKASLFDGTVWDPDPAVSALAALRLTCRPTPALTDVTLVSLGVRDAHEAGPNRTPQIPILEAIWALNRGVGAHLRRAREQLVEQFEGADSADRFVPLEQVMVTGADAIGWDDPRALAHLMEQGSAWADAHTAALADLAERLLVEG